MSLSVFVDVSAVGVVVVVVVVVAAVLGTLLVFVATPSSGAILVSCTSSSSISSGRAVVGDSAPVSVVCLFYRSRGQFSYASFFEYEQGMNSNRVGTNRFRWIRHDASLAGREGQVFFILNLAVTGVTMYAYILR